MPRFYLHRTLAVLVVLIALAACARPGQQATQPPIIGPDGNAIASAVAGTAQVAAQQTASSQSQLFGTVVPAGMTGTTVEQLPDGTSKYTDYEGRFEVTFPAGWLVLRPDSEEFDSALEKQGAANSMLRDQMVLDQTEYKSDLDRLYMYILWPNLKKNFMFGFSKLIWDSKDPTPVDNTTMGEFVRTLEARMPGFRVDNAQLQEGSIKMMEIGGRFTTNNSKGETIAFYQMYVGFKPSADSMGLLIFTFPDEYHAQVTADLKFIRESIRLIEQ